MNIIQYFECTGIASAGERDAMGFREIKVLKSNRGTGFKMGNKLYTVFLGDIGVVTLPGKQLAGNAGRIVPYTGQGPVVKTAAGHFHLWNLAVW